MIVDAVRSGYFQARFDHKHNTVHFGGQEVESDRVRGTIATMARRLTKALAMINPAPAGARAAGGGVVLGWGLGRSAGTSLIPDPCLLLPPSPTASAPDSRTLPHPTAPARSRARGQARAPGGAGPAERRGREPAHAGAQGAGGRGAPSLVLLCWAGLGTDGAWHGQAARISLQFAACCGQQGSRADR